MSQTLLSRVIALSKIDANLARAASEKKKLEEQLTKQKNQLLIIHKEVVAKAKVRDEKRTLYQKEEKFLKEEREKIAVRRKNLAAQNNYKLQQAAEKELDYATREISLKENALLESLEGIEKLDEEVTHATDRFTTEKDSYEALHKEVEATFPNIDERTMRLNTERQELVREIKPIELTLYERARSKFPTDAVVPLNEKQSCTGCFMSIGAQVLFQINKAESLVKCPGCNRILYTVASE